LSFSVNNPLISGKYLYQKDERALSGYLQSIKILRFSPSVFYSALFIFSLPLFLASSAFAYPLTVECKLKEILNGDITGWKFQTIQGSFFTSEVTLMPSFVVNIKIVPSPVTTKSVL
jgi:hypothetical protein